MPIRALVAQAAWAIVLVLSGSYDTITDYAIFAVLIFVGLVDGVGVRVPPDACRTRRARIARGAIRSCPSCSWSSRPGSSSTRLMTTPGRALAGLGLMAIGLPFYWYWTRGAQAAMRRTAGLCSTIAVRHNVERVQWKDERS